MDIANLVKSFVKNIPDKTINQLSSDVVAAARVAATAHPEEARQVKEALRSFGENQLQANDSLLTKIESEIFSHSSIRKLLEQQNSSPRLIAEYLPDPNAGWVKKIILKNPDLWFASGVGVNPNLDLNAEWVKEEIQRNPESGFASGVAKNPNLDLKAEWLQKISSKTVFGRQSKANPNYDLAQIPSNLDSRVSSGVGKHPNLDLNAEWVQEEIQRNPNTWFANDVGANPNLDPNAEWVKAKIHNDPDTWFASSVGANPNLDPNAQWVKEKIQKNSFTAFASGVGTNPNLDSNAQWIKDEIQKNPGTKFASFVGTSPHAQLRKILNADLEELTKIINANPHLVKSSALAKMLVKEKIIVPKS